MNLMSKMTATLRSTVLLFFIFTVASNVLLGSDVDDIVKKVHTKNSNQLIIDRLSPSKENPLPRDLLLTYTKDHRAELKGEVTYGGTPCYELIFRPREDDAFIVQTRVMVDKKTWLAVLFEQEDINENRTRYELRKFSINTPLRKNFPGEFARFPRLRVFSL